jgi:hypothetical protein
LESEKLEKRISRQENLVALFKGGQGSASGLSRHRTRRRKRKIRRRRRRRRKKIKRRRRRKERRRIGVEGQGGKEKYCNKTLCFSMAVLTGKSHGTYHRKVYVILNSTECHGCPYL